MYAYITRGWTCWRSRFAALMGSKEPYAHIQDRYSSLCESYPHIQDRT
jgi:hypothetical protein